MKQNSDDIQHILTESLVVGYVYCNIAFRIPFSITPGIDFCLISISAIIIAYFIGKLWNSKYRNIILERLKIRDSGNKYLWDDLMDHDYPMSAVIKYEDIEYSGCIHAFESYSNEPHIVLASYLVNMKNGNVEDNTEVNNKVIVLDISDAKSVEIVYDPRSSVCGNIQYLVKQNHRLYKKNNDRAAE